MKLKTREETWKVSDELTVCCLNSQSVHLVFKSSESESEIEVSREEIDDLIASLRLATLHFEELDLKEQEVAKLAIWGKARTPTSRTQEIRCISND